ncbi:hypothetical protein DXT68_00250 [Microbacterium foliorum]|uniref:Uncharacterized protein n=1 Tax=Microbacterium foliorum TaxID=104336 RepID=A0A0F0KMW7_9MICO|nr:hypothetical protein [Microbacterium foliorum]AXL10748.1 hypothetical protein DXT68_00250 [Microbacterium foliorum]KJL21784.1 hypothetical protein RN50_01685 [Microbacterium foliorum]
MKRNNRFVIWGLLAVGIALVIAWVFGVIAYGYEVDASAGIGTLRTQDVLLGAGSALCFVVAIIVAVTSRRRARRHHV